MLEEPYELIAHVRLCGEVDRVTGRLYPEPNKLAERDFRKLEIRADFGVFLQSGASWPLAG